MRRGPLTDDFVADNLAVLVGHLVDGLAVGVVSGLSDVGDDSGGQIGHLRNRDE